MDSEIFGCFFKVGFERTRSGDENIDIASMFRIYLVGEGGIRTTLKKLKHENYGKDLVLILFEFYVKPSEEEIQILKEIGSYRKKEKAIGIPILVTQENFFDQPEERRYSFLKETILKKLDVLAEVVKKKKLDTNVEQLKADLQKILV